MKDRISIEIKDHIADVRLNRPDKMNALDDAMFAAIIEVGEVIENDPDIWCVVFSGEGKAFCAGLDLSSFSNPDSAVNNASLAERTHGICNKYQKVSYQWRAMKVPVIAAVHHTCYGGGVQLISGADIRVVDPACRMSIMEIRWGIIPDMGGSQLLRHYMRDDVLRELSYTARVFDGRQAQEYGLATHVSEDPHAKAMDIALEITARNPDAVQSIKTLYNDAPYVSIADGYLQESHLQQPILASPNQLEAVYSQMQKRPANFSNPK